jgi:replicative DNA helicase
VVDYLQRVSVPRALQKVSREQQVSYISNELKNLALELDIVIWCPVQLNKEGEVRESTAIQFDADIVIKIGYAKGKCQIAFEKVRQAAKARPLPIDIDGAVQTIRERPES